MSQQERPEDFYFVPNSNELGLPIRCYACGVAFGQGQDIVSVSISTVEIIHKSLSGPEAGPWYFHHSFCQRCLPDLDPFAVIVPQLEIRIPETAATFACFVCQNAIEHGQKMVIAEVRYGPFTGTFPIEIQSADGLWNVCMSCAPRFDFTDARVPRKDEDPNYRPD